MGAFRILLTALLFLPVLKASTMQPSPFVHNGEPTNITVMEGSFASFSCLLTHAQTYSIDWMFNLSYVTTHGSSEVIDKRKYSISVEGPAKGEILSVKYVSKSEEGFYRCVVSVNGSSISNSSDGYLKVIPIPTLRHVPSNQTVDEGDNVTLHCALDNFDKRYFFVSWSWNEDNISRNYDKLKPRTFTDEYNIQGNKSLGLTCDLQVWKISRTSTGHFDCRVYLTSNHSLIAQSYPAFVDVLYPPDSESLVCEPSSTKEYYREGEMINTTCSVKGGKGPMLIQWTLGPNRSIENIALNGGKDSISARVEKSWNLTSRDDGSYIICSLTGNAISKEQSCSIGPLNVYYNPIVSILTNASGANIGDNAIFKCSIKSNPLINVTDYRWFVNGMIVSRSETFMIAVHENQSVLTVYNVTKIDENSIITCQADIGGSSNASKNLRLQPPSATPETLTSAPGFKTLSSRTPSSTETTIQQFNGAKTRRTSSNTQTTVQPFRGPNTLHFVIVPVVIVIIVVILGVVLVCKKTHHRKRADEPSRGNMEPAEQELQPVDPVKLKDTETKAESDVHMGSSFTSGPGEQNIDQLGEMNAPERNYGYHVKTAATDSTGLEVSGRDKKRFRNEEGLVYTELDFHEDGFDARKTRSAPTPFLTETSVTTYATVQFQPSTGLKR